MEVCYLTLDCCLCNTMYFIDQLTTVPQYTTVYYSIPQYTTVHRSILQYTTVYHSTPQYITVYHSIPQYTTVYYSIPHYTTVHHSILQYTTVYHSIPQHTTVYCPSKLVSLHREEIDEKLEKLKTVERELTNKEQELQKVCVYLGTVRGDTWLHLAIQRERPRTNNFMAWLHVLWSSRSSQRERHIQAREKQLESKTRTRVSLFYFGWHS